MNKDYKLFLNQMLWAFFAFILLIVVETILISLFTGYYPDKFVFLLWDKFDFFRIYFKEEPFDTFVYFLIERPLFKIEALQDNLTTVIWGFHFYSYTLVIHIIISILASRIIVRHTLTILALQTFSVSGSILLILSSLFLYLSSCCTSGAVWIIHSWLLSLVFNPFKATETILELYNNIHGWLIWIQYLMATSGVYLIIKKYKKYQPGS